jgi:hypothetical protein
VIPLGLICVRNREITQRLSEVFILANIPADSDFITGAGLSPG